MENNLIPRKENFFQKLCRLFRKMFSRKDKNKIENTEIVNTTRQENYSENSQEKEFLSSLRFEALINEDKKASSSSDKSNLAEKLRRVGYEFEEAEFISDINAEEDKEEFLKVYNNCINNNVDLKTIKAIDLVKINYILKKQLKRKRNFLQ